MKESIEITVSSRVAILKARQDKVRWIELPGSVYKGIETITSNNIVGYLQDKLVKRINFLNSMGDYITLKVRYENNETL
jgi:hypothetical protein